MFWPICVNLLCHFVMLLGLVSTFNQEQFNIPIVALILAFWSWMLSRSIMACLPDRFSHKPH